ncbi:MAG: LysM peptidoglycan-binding domain-containing protein [Planctomycetes bacterium]|nr:LysM peptidoglycan-binding domain-containing protein [Planctomycetota bacterium]
MSGTSKAVLSICVLLLAGLVVYYGMAPANTPQFAVGDIPTRAKPDEVQLFGRDLEAAAAALGIAPPIIEIAETSPVVEEIEEPQEALADAEVTQPASVDESVQEKPVKKDLILYTVVSGDTLGGIAHKLLGSAKYASNIAALNNIDDPRTIQLGRTLRIPEMKATPSSPVVANPDIPENVTTHVIRDGETLSDIASDYLGSPHKWMQIWEANKSRLSNPDRLKVGVSIVIP